MTEEKKEQLKRLMVQDFSESYDWAVKEFGENFDSVMAEIAVEITEAQYRAKKEISHITAGLMLCITAKEDFDDEQDRLEYVRSIKACIVWMIQNKPVI